MAEVTMYTTMLCPYCHRAKALLWEKSVEFQEIDVAMDREKRAEMVERSEGRNTVPQIFIGDTHIGGCDELYALNAEGKLDALLAA